MLAVAHLEGFVDAELVDQVFVHGIPIQVKAEHGSGRVQSGQGKAIFHPCFYGLVAEMVVDGPAGPEFIVYFSPDLVNPSIAAAGHGVPEVADDGPALGVKYTAPGGTGTFHDGKVDPDEVGRLIGIRVLPAGGELEGIGVEGHVGQVLEIEIRCHAIYPNTALVVRDQPVYIAAELIPFVLIAGISESVVLHGPAAYVEAEVFGQGAV